MKAKYDVLSKACSKKTTNLYSTSFSLGIQFIHTDIRDAIYAIYGFVRLADEIVDSFEDYNREVLLKNFRRDLDEALEHRISLNPILNTFQETVHQYNIDMQLVEDFLLSMEMDLTPTSYDREKYDKYIFGSAEVVGLMCLYVFVEGDEKHYQALKPYAMKLVSAYQKVNFLRDAQADFEGLGRTYFPNIDMTNFTDYDKKQIEIEVQAEFEEALIGIKRLPEKSRMGVYLAYLYYQKLFKKIQSVPATKIMQERIRIPNFRKIGVLINTYFKYQLNLI